VRSEEIGDRSEERGVENEMQNAKFRIDNS